MGEWVEYDDYIPKNPEEIRYNRWKGGVKRKKRATAMLLGGYCEGGVKRGECGKPYNHSFAFHHLSYRPDEKTYKDFGDTWRYNEYVIPIVRSRPEDFMLLCKECHRNEEEIKRRIRSIELEGGELTGGKVLDIRFLVYWW